MLRVVRRPASPGWRGALVVSGSALLALAGSLLLLGVQGVSPLAGLKVLVLGAFGSAWAIEDCLLKAIPLFLCSLGVAVAFRLQIWNIGAEGQFALGAIGATWVALSLPGLPKVVLLPLMITAACLAGGLWGLIPAIGWGRARSSSP